MEHQITLLAHLAAVDAQLDELHDDLGDLPQIVKKHELNVREKTLALEATMTALREIEHIVANAHVTAQEFSDKENRLSEQQFQVKNNREFDAITKELDHLKEQRTRLDEDVRTSAVRIDNLKNTIAQQEADLAEAKEVLADKERELEHVSGESNEELRRFIEMRKKLVPRIDNTLETEYERIRTFHREAVVSLRKNSCSGCFSAVPSQRIMEMKYNREKIFTCESCGRILFTEDLTVDIDALV